MDLKQISAQQSKVFRASQGMVLKMPVLDFERAEDAIAWLQPNDVNVYLADTDDAGRIRVIGPRGVTVVGSRDEISRGYSRKQSCSR